MGVFLSCNFNKRQLLQFKFSLFVYFICLFSLSFLFLFDFIVCVSVFLIIVSLWQNKTLWGVGVGEGSEAKVLMIWERVFQLHKGAWEGGWALPRRKPEREGERDSEEELLLGCVRNHRRKLMWQGCLIVPLLTPLSKVDVLLHLFISSFCLVFWVAFLWNDSGKVVNERAERCLVLFCFELQFQFFVRNSESF